MPAQEVDRPVRAHSGCLPELSRDTLHFHTAVDLDAALVNRDRYGSLASRGRP